MTSSAREVAVVGFAHAPHERRTAGTTDPDSINEYEVEIGIDASIGYAWHGFVEHRYGDGAWELVAKALALAVPRPR